MGRGRMFVSIQPRTAQQKPSCHFHGTEVLSRAIANQTGDRHAPRADIVARRYFVSIEMPCLSLSWLSLQPKFTPTNPTSSINTSSFRIALSFRKNSAPPCRRPARDDEPILRTRAPRCQRLISPRQSIALLLPLPLPFDPPVHPSCRRRCAARSCSSRFG